MRGLEDDNDEDDIDEDNDDDNDNDVDSDIGDLEWESMQSSTMLVIDWFSFVLLFNLFSSTMTPKNIFSLFSLLFFFFPCLFILFSFFHFFFSFLLWVDGMVLSLFILCHIFFNSSLEQPRDDRYG